MGKKIFYLVFLFVPLFLHAQNKLKNNKSESSIRYHMKHALHEWTGISRELSCLMETDNNGMVQKVAAVVKISTFDSKNSNRDSHMLEITHALKYPNISFVSNAVRWLGSGKYQVSGKLNFHGQEKPLELTITEEKKDGKRVFTGGLTILLEDFKIERPTLMLVKTDNEVVIDMNIVF